MLTLDSSLLNAQSLIADQELAKGESYRRFVMRDSALYHFQNADSLYEGTQSWNQHIKCKAMIAQLLFSIQNFGEAMKYIEEGIAYGKEKEGNHDASLGVMYIHKGIIGFIQGQPVDTALAQLQTGLDYFEKGQVVEEEAWGYYYFKAMIFYFTGQLEDCKTNAHQSLKMIAHSSKKEEAGTATIHNLLGVTCKKEKKFDQAIFHYEEAIRDYESLEQTNEKYNFDRLKANPYHNLGNVFFETGEYEKALIYLRKALIINRKILDANSPHLGICYFSIGNIFYNQARYSEALEQYSKAEKIFNSPSGNPLYSSSLYQNQGICHHTFQQYDLALTALNKALRLRQETPGMDPMLEAETLQEIGRVYMKKNELERAEKIQRKALALYRSIPGDKNGEIANSLKTLGDLLLKSQKTDEALETFHESLKSNMIGSTVAFSMDELPAKEQRSYMPNVFIEAIGGKGQALYLQYLRSGDEQLLKQAHQHYIRCDQMIRKERRRFDQANDQITFNKLFHKIYQEAVEVTYECYKKEPQLTYIEQAVQFSEQSKTQALLATLTRNTVLHYPGVSKKMIKREKRLQKEVNALKERLELNQGTAQDSSRSDLEEELFERTTQYEKLLDTLKQSSPTYYEWVYQNDQFDAQKIQHQLLKNGEHLIEYFISNTQIHIFHFSADHFSWTTSALPKDLKKEVSQYLSAIHDQHILQYSGQPVAKSKRLEADQTYAKLGQSFYQLLLQPLSKENPASRLIIVTDGVLGNLPFETLLTSAPTKIGAYHNYPYVLNQHQISYGYSIDLLLQLQNKQKAAPIQQGWLALAPKFNDCRQLARQRSVNELRSESFGPLQNKAEVLSIHEIIGGKVLLDQEASMDNFLEQGPQYAFLHIASHGKANNQHPGWSMIGLSSESENPCLFDTLRAARIATLSLPAEMVVLSACEGAVGELQEGEGIQSLAMAFTYAGAQSLCSTLWSVQDKAMKEIMTAFYTHLDQGMNKDEALRKAKLDYISFHDNTLSHPFYWAAPILIGDARSVSFGHSFSWSYGLLIGLLVLFLLYSFLRRKP